MANVDGNGDTVVVSARVSEYERLLIQTAAARRETSASSWLREMAVREAHRELTPGQPDRGDDGS